MLPLAMAVAALGAGCANLERSRNLADPDVSGKTLAEQVCSNCHGLDGNSVSPNVPNLAAQQKAYLTAQLEGFRMPGRSDPAGFEYMWGLSHHLTDKQIDELADYFAAQKWSRRGPEKPPRGNRSSRAASLPRQFRRASRATESRVRGRRVSLHESRTSMRITSSSNWTCSSAPTNVRQALR
jgi:cytochrome c553